MVHNGSAFAVETCDEKTHQRSDQCSRGIPDGICGKPVLVTVHIGTIYCHLRIVSRDNNEELRSMVIASV